MNKTPFLLALLLSAAPTFATQMYSWTDAQGVRHFSDTPPPGQVEAKKLTVRGGVTAQQPIAQDPPQGTGEGPAMAAAAGYSEADIQRNCDIARSNLAALEAGTPPEDSSEEILAEHNAGLEKTQAQIQLFCGQ